MTTVLPRKKSGIVVLQCDSQISQIKIVADDEHYEALKGLPFVSSMMVDGRVETNKDISNLQDRLVIYISEMYDFDDVVNYLKGLEKKSREAEKTRNDFREKGIDDSENLS